MQALEEAAALKPLARIGSLVFWRRGAGTWHVDQAEFQVSNDWFGDCFRYLYVLEFHPTNRYLKVSLYSDICGFASNQVPGPQR